MPTPCLHYKLLSDRFAELAAKFVNDQATAEITDMATFQPDLDRLAAFRLLVHAEIEDFLESKAIQNLSKIAMQMTAGNWMRQSPELLAMAISLKRGMPSVDVLDSAKFAGYVTDLIAGARNAVSENNGVKAASFLLLSICSGKVIDEIDGVLSASLNSYGKARGDVAHRSVTHSTSLQAPSAELATAKGLVDQIGVYYDVCP
jgi:hypothetical protein